MIIASRHLCHLVFRLRSLDRFRELHILIEIKADPDVLTDLIHLLTRDMRQVFPDAPLIDGKIASYVPIIRLIVRRQIPIDRNCYTTLCNKAQ